MGDKAREKNLFLMEAVWTRYFPLSIKVRELVTSGAIGTVYRTLSDLSFNNSADDGGLTFPNTNRMVNLDLAGGALLDLGIYALTWVFQSPTTRNPRAPRRRPRSLPQSTSTLP